MSKKILILLLCACIFCPKVEAASVFGQGGQWNEDFADKALSDFNALETDSAWVAQLRDLPDNTWIQANPSGIPALASNQRAEVPMVYMPEYKAMFYTAGDHEVGGSYNSDSWAYSINANTWVQMQPNYIKNSPLNQEPYPTDRPAGRCSFGLSYDTDRGKLVLRGGANTGSGGLITWEYDFSINRWETTAPKTSGYQRAEDNNLGFIPGFGTIEVGGSNFKNTLAAETWVYRPAANSGEESSWEKIATNGAPPGAHNSQLVWASEQERLIYWGRAKTLDGSRDSELWAFDPATSTWEDISPTSGPSPDGFYRNGLVYDSTSNVIKIGRASCRERV